MARSWLVHVSPPSVARRIDLNTDLGHYGGSGVGNAGHIFPEAKAWDEQPASCALALPPLSVLWLVPARQLA